MREVSGHTKQLCIIGCPIEHTFSPNMHNFISEAVGADYVYSAFEVRQENLADAVRGMRALGIAGANVTAPHKKAVMEYLDEISEQAKLLGSVNTIVNKNGRLIGYNTDADGFLSSLTANGVDVGGRDILIFGAGGVTMPTVIRLIQEKPASVTVINRTKSKAERLCEAVREAVGFEVNTEKKLPRYDIVINTTSAGMEPQLDKMPTDDMPVIDKDTAVVDMIYNPDKTLFLQEAEKRGAKTINGLGMLIYQGIIAYELFTGLKLGDDMYEKIAHGVFGR